ncbi:hypothetical protein D9M70_540380 [compost metagenome]
MILGQVGIQAASLALVEGKHVLRLDQFIDRATSLVPDIGGRRGRVLELVFVLLQLGLVLLDLLERLRNALHRSHYVLTQVGPVNHRDTGMPQRGTESADHHDRQAKSFSG